MVNIRSTKTRLEIERELQDQDFSLEFEDRDDQIWMNKEQDELLFISWINGSMYVYKRTETVDL